MNVSFLVAQLLEFGRFIRPTAEAQARQRFGGKGRQGLEKGER